MYIHLLKQPDKTSHKKGPNDKGIAESMMPKVDRTINYLLESIKENNLEETLNVIITRFNHCSFVPCFYHRVNKLNFYIKHFDLLKF